MAFELIVTLCNGKQFHGARRIVLHDVPDLHALSFNDKPSSVIVSQGPHYRQSLANNQEPRVRLYRDINYGGPHKELRLGQRPVVAGKWSSVQMVFVPVPVAVAPTLPLIVELYDQKNFTGRHITVISDSSHLGHEFSFNNLPSSLKVMAGPGYQGEKVILYRDSNFAGPHQGFNPGDHADLSSFATNLNNKATSLKIVS